MIPFTYAFIYTSLFLSYRDLEILLASHGEKTKQQQKEFNNTTFFLIMVLCWLISKPTFSSFLTILKYLFLLLGLIIKSRPVLI